jgi:hypothetical protein
VIFNKIYFWSLLGFWGLIGLFSLVSLIMGLSGSAGGTAEGSRAVSLSLVGVVVFFGTTVLFGAWVYLTYGTSLVRHRELRMKAAKGERFFLAPWSRSLRLGLASLDAPAALTKRRVADYYVSVRMDEAGFKFWVGLTDAVSWEIPMNEIAGLGIDSAVWSRRSEWPKVAAGALGVVTTERRGIELMLGERYWLWVVRPLSPTELKAAVNLRFGAAEPTVSPTIERAVGSADDASNRT